jgi:hypothetical protein
MNSRVQRRAFAAYAAGIAAIACLMYVVALGGNAVTPKSAMTGIASTTVAAPQR